MHRTHAGHGSIWPAEAVEAHASLDAAERASRAREDALREAGAEAKTAWLHYPRGEIGDADHDSALCEYVAERIALIDKPKDAPAPLPAAPVDGGEDAH